MYGLKLKSDSVSEIWVSKDEEWAFRRPHSTQGICMASWAAHFTFIFFWTCLFLLMMWLETTSSFACVSVGALSKKRSMIFAGLLGHCYKNTNTDTSLRYFIRTSSIYLPHHKKGKALIYTFCFVLFCFDFWFFFWWNKNIILENTFLVQDSGLVFF